MMVKWKVRRDGEKKEKPWCSAGPEERAIYTSRNVTPAPL